ncbi:MAG: hypothetical protein OSJ68_10700, partial [Clostridia bacterium]|nr:hypothetical protein [Clostridia bacterium]
TSTEDGWASYEACENCDYSTRVLIARLNHNFGEWTVTKPPACAAEGERIKICENDNNHILKEAIDKLGHTAGEWVDVEYAACENDGQTVLECKA